MSLPSWARVGAKVVCVDDRLPPCVTADNDRPQLGCVYTIAAVWFDECGAGCALRELRRAPSAYAKYGERTGYYLSRFRPLVTLEDDMAAHFRALLDTPAPTERERA